MATLHCLVFLHPRSFLGELCNDISKFFYPLLIFEDHKNKPMTKTLLFSLAALSIGLASCGKNDDDAGSNSGNYWKVNGTTYNVSHSQTSNLVGYNLTATDVTTVGGPSNSVAFLFDTKPSANGTMLIGDAEGRLGLSVIVDGSTKKSYFNQEISGMQATYAFNNGKITVDVPETWVVSGSGTDSVRFSAHVTEQ